MHRTGAAEVPGILNDCLAKARRWSTPGQSGPPNSFIQGIINLRLSFYDFGFTIKADGNAAKFEAWRKANAAAIASYRREAWLEWLRVDNVVALWRAKSNRVFRVKPERCEYTDELAIEELKYTHYLTPAQIDRLAGLTAAQKLELKTHSTITLTKEDASLFGFEVIKRAPVGEGFAWPTLMGAFLPASGHESLQVADAQLAFMMRRVYEQHKCGHETRYGVGAGGSANFLKKPMKEAVEKGLKGKKGAVELVTRHDHAIEQGAGRPDPKHFNATRYDGFKAQLIDWAMPLGHMLFAKTLNPYLLQFLRQLAQLERDYLKPHLEAVFERGLGAPGPVTVTWGNKCFNDSRLAFDMVKTGLAGPLSQETFLRDIDQDPDAERARKEKEAALPKTQTMPLIVPQGAASPDRAGRKRNSPDRKS